jgi:hypothetical protein
MDRKPTGVPHANRRRLNRRTGVSSALFLGGVLVLALGGVPGGAGQPSAGAATPAAVNQCNGTDDAGGQAVACTVSVINNVDLGTGLSSSRVTVTECHGAANVEPSCATTVKNRPGQPVTSVTQCNGSGNGGGGTVTCVVEVLNNITGTTAGGPASINQCIGSGTGGGIEPTILCTPLGSTTDAVVDQCNSSGNGGGGTIRVRCTVLPSTQATALPVTIDQCNGSGNGGGATVTCTASLVNSIIRAPVTTGPPTVTAPVTTGPPTVTAPVTTGPPTATAPVTSGPPVTTVSPPVVSPPAVGSPPFVPPPGLTGDSPPSAGESAGHHLRGIGALLLIAGVLSVPRRRLG